MGSNYWQKRFEFLENQRNKVAIDTVQSITPAFNEAQAKIEKEINAWYGRFAKNNEISLQEAKKLLNTKELKEFRWDVQEYIKYGRQNAIDQKWMKELENASARFHISRLEALKIRTQNAAEQAFGNELDALDEMAARIYMDDYYHTAYEIQKGLGVGFDVSKIDQRKLDSIVSKPWTTDKMTFSDRIWKAKTQLLDSLHTELTQMCILGKEPDEVIRNISQRMGVSKGQAGRLIMTEAAYFGSVAQKDCFNDLDVEKYEVVATLDNRTSEVCQKMDGQVFDMKDFQAGVTAPPFHCWCRSCTAPWFADNDDGTRVARDEEGKTYEVPASMKYEDWKQCFVDKTKDPADWLKLATAEDVIEAGKQVDEIRKAIKLEPDMFPPSFTATKQEAKNTQLLMDYVNNLDNANPDAVELYSKMRKMENIESEGIPWKIGHGDQSGEVSYHYHRVNNKLTDAQIKYPKLTGDNFTGQVNVTLHEQMHLMDMYCRRNVSYGDNWFSSTHDGLKDIFRNVTDSSQVKLSDKVKKLFDDFRIECDNIQGLLRKDYDSIYKELLGKWKNHEISASEFKKLNNKAWSKYTTDLNYQKRNACGGGIDCLQDIYDALSGGRFRDTGVVQYGHGGKYYSKAFIGKRCEETLANYGALSITRPDLVELLREDYPDLVDMLDEVVGEMLKKVGE